MSIPSHSPSHPSKPPFPSTLQYSISNVKKPTKFQTTKRSTQVLHSDFKSFTDMTKDLPSITFYTGTPRTNTSSTDLLYNTSPFIRDGTFQAKLLIE